jgi:peptidoglycan/LPS O-acetylase OafA/YrhL
MTSWIAVARRSIGPAQRTPAPHRHYHVVDLVRGLGALAILFWHYQHFVTGTDEIAASHADYPLYRLFWPLYDFGGTAVQLFWIVSGFVFAVVYSRTPTSAGIFFRHRFARLYPLHFVTLVVVCVLQLCSVARLGSPLIYRHNDPMDFLLQLFMASGWGFRNAFSFNGPVWSVSAEAIAYALFWLSLRWLFSRGVALPMLLAVLAEAVYYFTGSAIADCGFYFFIGCALFAFDSAYESAPRVRVTCTLLLIAAAIVLLAIGKIGIALLFLYSGLTLLCAACEGTVASTIARRVPWLADNTYSSYLWHVPIQIALLLGFAVLGIDRRVVLSVPFFLAYLMLVTVIARASFLMIERPARGAINRRARAAVPPA